MKNTKKKDTDKLFDAILGKSDPISLLDDLVNNNHLKHKRNKQDTLLDEFDSAEEFADEYIDDFDSYYDALDYYDDEKK